MSTHDPVNNPKHYDLFPGQQSIDVIRAALTPEEFVGFCKGNALKYRLRAGEKGDAAEDLAKAKWYRDLVWQPMSGSKRKLLDPGSIRVNGHPQCKACGGYHADGGSLPCPNMRPYS